MQQKASLMDISRFYFILFGVAEYLGWKFREEEELKNPTQGKKVRFSEGVELVVLRTVGGGSGLERNFFPVLQKGKRYEKMNKFRGRGKLTEDL